MKCKVGRWYEDGICKQGELNTVSGTLCLYASTHPMTGARIRIARLEDRTEKPLLPILYDAVVVDIGNFSMQIKGVDIDGNGKETEQEWLCLMY